ncbi:hypothetical protein COLO4_38052 [Corchorus olitorius]|uniref:Uncharacterized protein n=1 Tax=Corchorus olitorius TaxID=93759 RepID=A0A1R3FX92_9ROSI|nr:hypothetical protein COLO4_38052 [Corchorus olitorius]
MKPKNGDQGGRIMWESEGPFERVAGRDKISEPARKTCVRRLLHESVCVQVWE